MFTTLPSPKVTQLNGQLTVTPWRTRPSTSLPIHSHSLVWLKKKNVFLLLKKKIDCTDVADQVILDQDFEDPLHAEGWIKNWDGNAIESSEGLGSFLGRLGKEKEEISRTLVVPASAESVLIEFTFNEIDQWESTDRMYFRMQGYYLSFGYFSHGNSENAISGHYFSTAPEDQRVAVAVWRETEPSQLGFNTEFNDQKHRVTFIVPKYYFPDQRLRIGFRTRMSYPIENESAGIDDIKVTVNCGAPPTTDPPTPAPTEGAGADSEPEPTPTAAPTTIERAPSVDEASAPSAAQQEEPPTGGGSWGDPHFKTWHGQVYDFHGSCDLVLARSEKLGFEAHVRTSIRHDWSFVSGVAVKIGNDILEVGGHRKYYINGVEGAELPSTLSGFPVSLRIYDTDAALAFDKFIIDLGEHGGVVIKVFGEFLAISINKGVNNDVWEGTLGLMGGFETGELLGRDGKTIFKDTNLFGVEWQVNNDQAPFFQQADGPQFPAMCNLPRCKANDHRRLIGESGVTYAQAEKACSSLPLSARESCIFDATTTGNLEMAAMGLD